MARSNSLRPQRRALCLSYLLSHKPTTIATISDELDIPTNAVRLILYADEAFRNLPGNLWVVVGSEQDGDPNSFLPTLKELFPEGRPWWSFLDNPTMDGIRCPEN